MLPAFCNQHPCHLSQGACCDVRCFNTPHNWQLGWGRPIATLNSLTMPSPGTWMSFILPSQQSAAANMVLIQPDWTSGYTFGNTYTWFIGYRQVESLTHYIVQHDAKGGLDLFLLQGELWQVRPTYS